MNIIFGRIYRNLSDIPFIIFCVLLFFIQFNTRKVFPSSYTYISGHFNDFVTYSLYFTDIIAAIYIIFFTIINYQDIKRKFATILNNNLYKILLLFFTWAFFSTLFNTKYYDLSIYYLFRLSLYLFLAFSLFITIKNLKSLYISFIVISTTGLIQSFIAIFQSLSQSSIFGNNILHKLTGESIIGTNVIGTSNTVINGDRFIRAYGTFPHPNILAGYLLITLLITILLLTSRPYILNFLKYNTIYYNFCQVLISRKLLIFSLILQLISISATFSRSGFIALTSITILFILAHKIVPRGTIFNVFKNINNAIFTNTNFNRIIFAFAILAISVSSFYFFLMRTSSESIAHQSFQDRLYLLNVSRETIFAKPLFGTGIGTYTLNLMSIRNTDTLYYWQFQPDHNIYTLIASEIGIVGLVIFIMLITTIIKSIDKLLQSSDKKNDYSIKLLITLKYIVYSILIISILDHYFWTSPQMILLFWIIIGSILSVAFNIVPRETINDKL